MFLCALYSDTFAKVCCYIYLYILIYFSVVFEVLHRIFLNNGKASDKWQTKLLQTKRQAGITDFFDNLSTDLAKEVEGTHVEDVVLNVVGKRCRTIAGFPCYPF